MQVRNAAGVTLGRVRRPRPGVRRQVLYSRCPSGLPAATASTSWPCTATVRSSARYRWLIDLNSDGVVNTALGEILTLQPPAACPATSTSRGDSRSRQLRRQRRQRRRDRPLQRRPVGARFQSQLRDRRRATRSSPTRCWATRSSATSTATRSTTWPSSTTTCSRSTWRTTG